MNKTRTHRIAGFILLCLWAPMAFAQVPKSQSIVTNGQLTEEHPFHVLIIHNSDPQAARIAQMVRQPTGEMRSWANSVDMRLMHSSEPFVAQHHSDLIVKHQNQTPIVALVDRSGGVWWSVAGSEVPTNERSLASTLSTAYSATLKAASEPPQPSYPSPGYPSNLRPPVQPAQAYAMPAQRDSGSYFLERSGVSAPDPVRLPALNANSTHAIRTTVAADASSALAIIAAVAIACSIILAAGPVIGSNVIAHAITEDNDQPIR